jgi:hypothetical protein
MEKEKTIKKISKILQKNFCDHSIPECDIISAQVYSLIMQSEKIKRMTSGKCKHEMEIIDEDGFYPEHAKSKCIKCGLIRLKKIK